MSKYSSKLGEEVSLTQEDLIEMKLLGEYWSIFISPHYVSYFDVIRALRRSTNLLQKSSSTPTLASPTNKYQQFYPIVDILAFDIDDGRLLWKLHTTECCHTIISKQD